MNKSSFGERVSMKFDLEVSELKDALFQHLRKQMTAEEEQQYLQGKPQMSVDFYPYSSSVLKFEIINKEK